MTINPHINDAHRIARAATHRRWQVMTAESCTGGLAAAALTALPGASHWFSGGVVVYSNAMKQTLLQVAEAALNTHGAVSEETARAMCAGLLLLGAHAALSITGVAGPDGGSEDKPVGTVCFAFHTPETRYTVTRHFDGDRAAVRNAATAYALQNLAEAMAPASSLS